MKLYNRKKKEWVPVKEALSQWKQGMQNITPLQQTYSTLFGQFVSGVGVIWGIVFSIYLAYWWMMVILIGGIIVLGTQVLGTYQRMILLKQVEDSYKSALQIQLNESEVKE